MPNLCCFAEDYIPKSPIFRIYDYITFPNVVSLTVSKNMWYKYVTVSVQIRSLLACWNKGGLESAALTEVIGKTSIFSTCHRVRHGESEIFFLLYELWG